MIVSSKVLVSDCCGPALSVTVTSKLKVPLAFGVPLISPVPELRVKFAGGVPDQVNDPWPPTAVTVTE